VRSSPGPPDPPNAVLSNVALFVLAVLGFAAGFWCEAKFDRLIVGTAGLAAIGRRLRDMHGTDGRHYPSNESGLPTLLSLSSRWIDRLPCDFRVDPEPARPLVSSEIS
jgi:hypothetical protein